MSTDYDYLSVLAPVEGPEQNQVKIQNLLILVIEVSIC